MKWKWILVLSGWLVCAFCGAQNQLAMLKPSLRDLPIEAPVGAAQYISLPFQLVNKMVYLEAELEGETGLMILDTGSPSIVVNRELRAADRSLSAATLGADVNIHEVSIDRLRLGRLDLRNLPGLAIPFGQFGGGLSEKVLGLAGYGLLKDYEALFDYEHGRLHLFPAEKAVLHRVAEPVVQAPLALEGHLPVVTLQIGERKFRFGLDTGAAANILDLSHLGDLPEELVRLLPMEQLRCLDGPYQDVEAATVHQLSLEGYPLQPMKFLFADLSSANAHAEEPLDGLLGYAFFNQLLCSINYRQRKLFIWQRAEGANAM